jgi:signal transduction histidine kinase
MDLIKIIAFLFILSPIFLDAQVCPVRIEDHLEQINLESKISIYPTENHLVANQAFDSILLSKKSLHCTEKTSFGFSRKFYWLTFTLQNNSNDSINLYIELDNPHIDTVEFYQQMNRSFILQDQVGDMMIFAERDIPNRRFLFPIGLSKNDTAVFLMKLDKRTGAISFPLKVWKKENFDKREKTANLLHFLYFGGLWFLAIFSMVMGILVRNKRIFIYGIYISFMGLYLFTALGYASQYLYPDSSSLNNVTRSQFMLLTISSFILFSIYYLNLDKHSKIFYKILLFIASILLILSFSSILFASFFFTYIYFFLKLVYILIFITAPIIFLAIATTFKVNKRLNIAYLGAFSMLLTGTALNIFIEFGWIDEDYFLINPILIASIFELFIFSNSFIFEIKSINDKKNFLLEQKTKLQKELSAAYITGSEAERSRISKELHDNIGSRLALLKNKVSLDGMSKTKLNEEVNMIFQDVKNISNQLSPNHLQILGFTESVQSLFNELAISTNIQVYFTSDPNIGAFNPNVELQLYRVMQELIQNIIKHSHATEVKCQMMIENGQDLIIKLHDNGVGYHALKKISPGNGLKNVLFRIESINGSIEATSAPREESHCEIKIEGYKNEHKNDI